MTKAFLQPGHRGCDYSGARPTMQAVKAAGGRFIGRYSAGAFSGDPASQWKLCGPGEIAAAVDAGLDFVAISESYESRVTEGHAAGVADGAADAAFWRSRGLAKGATVFACWDTGPTADKYAAVGDYLDGWNAGAAGQYTAGLYGGDPVIRWLKQRGHITHGIQPNATSWSGGNLPYAPSNPAALLGQAQAASAADVWQTGNYWLGKNADECMVLRVPFGSHLQALNGATAQPEDDLMALDPKERAALVADIAAAAAEKVWAHTQTPEGQKNPRRMDIAVANALAHAGEAVDALKTVTQVLGTPKSGVAARVASLQAAVDAVSAELKAIDTDVLNGAAKAVEVDAAKVAAVVVKAVEGVTFKAVQA